MNSVTEIVPRSLSAEQLRVMSTEEVFEFFGAHPPRRTVLTPQPQDPFARALILLERLAVAVEALADCTKR